MCVCGFLYDYNSTCNSKLSFLFEIDREQGGEAIAAHLVVKKRDFYFHRVVFESEEEALRIYRYVRFSPPQPFSDSWLPKQSFPYQVVLRNEVPVYVNKSSKALLKFIISASNQ